MKRFRRRLNIVLIILSLLICAATAILWPLSYILPWNIGGHWDGPLGPRGGVLNGIEYPWNIQSEYGRLVIDFPFLPFISVEYWSVLLFSALAPLGRLFSKWTRIKANRVAQGLCPNCGYDLRATPDRCPECGTPREPQNRGPETAHA
jgi:hypothetical protein